MSLPDPIPPRKLLRLGLWLPFVALGVFITGWSATWFWARGQVAARMDAAVEAADRAGYRIAWKDRAIGGYPFRLDVTLTEPRIHEPSGWALEAPRLEGEAFMHAPTHWLIAAPDGLTFVRPQGGPVAVKGQLLRASLTHLTNHPPNFSFEGVKLAFAPQPGAEPFALAYADRFEFHLRAGPNDEGGVFTSLEGGKAQGSGLFGRLAGPKPVAMVWNSTLSRISAFTGANWPDAVRHWSDAGGRMTVRNAGITAGDVVAGVTSGTLSTAADGRLSGMLALTLRQAPRGLAALSETGVITPQTAEAATLVVQARQGSAESANASLDFQAGRTTLGPVALGAAPRIYSPN